MSSFNPLPRAAVLLAAALLLPSPAAAQNAQGTNVQAAAERFVRLAYDGRFADLRNLWTADAAGRRGFERQIRNALRVRCIEVDGVEFTSLNDTSAEIVVALRSDVAAALDIVPLRLRFDRSSGALRIAAVEFPDDELAARLMAAGREEHAPLLAANERRLTRNLVRILFQRTVPLILATDIRPAIPYAELTRDAAVLAGDRGGESLALALLSIVARVTGNRPEGIRLGRESLRLAEESGDPLALTRAYINSGRTTASFDQFSPVADEYYRRAFEASKRVDDPALTVRALAHLTDSAALRRDLLTVRRNTEEGLRLMDESGDPFGDLRPGFIMQLAQVYLDQGDLEQALYHIERTLALVEGSDSYQLPGALLVKGKALRRLGRRDEARAVLARISRLSVRADDLNGIAGALDERAILEADGGDLAEAECLLRESSKYYRRMGFDSAGDFRRIVPHFLAAGDYRNALRLSLEQAHAAERQAVDELAAALTGAAAAYRGLGDNDRAMTAIVEAIERGESFHQRVAGSEEQRIRSAASIVAGHELAADLALARGEAGRALAFLDRGRGRVLHDIVENGRPSLDAELDHADRESRQKLERLLAGLNVELARAEARGDAAKAAALRGRLDQARRDYETFVDGLHVRHDRRQAAQPRMISFEELGRRVPSGVTMLVFAVRDPELHAFAARRDGSGALRLAQKTTPITRARLDERVRRFAGMMKSGDLRYRAAATDLYALLVGPLEKEIAAAGVLCIVPDESLWQLPFAALIDRRGRFLIERAAVVYAPSISVYAAVVAHRGTRRDAPSVLAVANPTLERETANRLTSFYRDAKLGALPHAEVEADAICAMYPAGRCLALKGHHATESRAKSQMPDRGIVHFATHGVLDDRNPMYSRLVLARGDDPVDDGSLEAWEITRLTLDADLVVLSACDTARGEIGGGEGVVGMAWSFFVAGARSTLATQWRVESDSAARLMIQFHRSLLEAHGPLKKAHALRKAQLQLLRHDKTRHPFYWAAFVLLGDAS